MGIFTAEELARAEAIGELARCNPFLPERLTLERRVLGDDYVGDDRVWNARDEIPDDNQNVLGIKDRGEELVRVFGARSGAGTKPSAADRRAMARIADYVLYYRYVPQFYDLLQEAVAGETGTKAPFFKAFVADWRSLFTTAGLPADDEAEAAHLFACLFQIRRAFYCIFSHILGPSLVTARLRAAVWQSIFASDMERYRRSLYNRLGDITVLINGPSGTGKELVARAIAFSRYIPFDHRRGEFAANWRTEFRPLNLAALSPTLIESELFGHRRGSFTGALDEHQGWFETCDVYGTVFLDEIGEIPLDIQAKLLRVLESRVFTRLGETQPREFAGKLIAATNRELGAEINAGRFRTDLYYRLCADTIRAPSLSERVASDPAELATLVRFIAVRVAGPTEATPLTEEAMAWIGANLPADYPWPGNVRELEQCVRNIMLRGEYRPAHATAPDDFWGRAKTGKLTADELLSGYCRQAYERLGSYEAAGRALGLDRRTVMARVKDQP